MHAKTTAADSSAHGLSGVRGALAPLLAGALALGLTGCISFGKEPPDSLLTLTPATQLPAGPGASGKGASALAVTRFEAPARLQTTRVPVQVDPANLAYLKDASWVDRPVRLFQTLVADTLRNRGDRLITDGSDPELGAGTVLRGTLTDFGYDVPSASVVVRFDAVRQGPSGEITTRRFEQSVPGVEAKAGPVGEALNQAANRVAQDIAAWIG